MTHPIKIAVAGIHGRMGRAIVAGLEAEADFVFAGGFGRAGSTGGGVIDRSAAIEIADVILDFSTGSAAFARGALLAVRWIVGRAPGEYDMQDVLGLSHAKI